MAARQVPGSTRTSEEPRAEDETRLWKFINGVFSQLKQDCPIFGILVIGETGTGKSTLINNLLGREVAVVGNTMESETQLVTAHELSVEGVPVVVYDTPGLGDTREDDDKKHLDIMKSLIARKKIHLVIYCMKLTETRMRRSLIRTFEEYHKIGVPWEQTVVTITFADMIVDTTGRFSQVQQHLKKTLVEKVGVTSSVVDRLKICPTAKDPTEALPSGRQWYVPFWLDVVEVLVPAALAQFLYIHKGNIHMEGTAASRLPNPVNITLVGEDQERFRREVDRLPYQPVAATALPDAVTDGPSATTPPTETAAEEVLDHFRDRFIKDTASSAIVYELKHRDVIASGDVEMIERNADVTQQNQYLHECLMRKCTKEALTEVCNVMSAVRGNPKMNALGEDMRRRVKGSETPSSAHPPIGVRQTASNSKEAEATSTVALPTSPAFPSPPQQTPVRDPDAATPLPIATPPPPDTADIVKALNHQLDARWRHFGTFLLVDYQTMESIETRKCGRPDDCMLDLLGRWTSNQTGTGTLPRTWQTVVEAVKETGFGAIAENLAHKHGLTLSQ